MRYTHYYADGHVILAEQIETDEIVCHACGASWLHESPLALDGCPYCGDAGFVYKAAPAEVTILEDAATYGRTLRGIIHGLWAGTFDASQAYELFADVTRIELTRAWYAGMKECGVLPDEMTPEERIALLEIIVSEQSHIWTFLVYVEGHNKAGKFRLAPLTERVEMWAYRYTDVQTRAKLMTCGDKKLRWTLNYIRGAKENCPSCVKLNGKVKRASYWYRVQVMPQNPPNAKLECGGWKCACGLPETDEPMSKGPLPNLP